MAKRGRKPSLYRMKIAGLVVRAWRDGHAVKYQGAPGEACVKVAEANHISSHTALECYRDYKHMFLDKNDRRSGPVKRKDKQSIEQVSLALISEPDRKIAYLKERANSLQLIGGTPASVVERQLERQCTNVMRRAYENLKRELLAQDTFRFSSVIEKTDWDLQMRGQRKQYKHNVDYLSYRHAYKVLSERVID